MRRTTLNVCVLLTLAVAAWSASVTAQKENASARKSDAANLPQRIWQDPGEMATLDLMYGNGGKVHAPDAAGPYTFVKEDPLGTNPKFEVTDAQGVHWKVKLGEESRPETAATRFLWAAGYFTDEDYYMAQLTVTGLPILKRGQSFVSSGGIVHGARLERKVPGIKTLENWDWFDNPFLGKRELNGLRVMMSLLNNWDLKVVNNSIYVVDGERHYVVSDAGATFGNTGNALTRSKDVPKAYAASAFIAKATPDFMDFVLHSRPFFVSVVQPGNYRDRTRMEDVTRHIPRADAKWLGDRLSKLTDAQIRDAFCGAGFESGDVEILTRTIRTRIAALEAL